MSKKRTGHPRPVAGELVPRSDPWAVEHVTGRRGPLGPVETPQVRSMPVTAWVRGYPVPMGPLFMPSESTTRQGEESPEVQRKLKKGKLSFPTAKRSLQAGSTASSLIGAVVKVPERQFNEQLLLAKLSSHRVSGLVS